LLSPEGQLALESPLNQLHLVIDMVELDFESRIVFKLPDGSLAFKKANMAAIDVRKLVVDSIKSDPAFLDQSRRQARAQIVLGIVMFLVCGSLFALYCWWASVTSGLRTYLRHRRSQHFHPLWASCGLMSNSVLRKIAGRRVVREPPVIRVPLAAEAASPVGRGFCSLA
jgi:hypothetical protein